MFRSEIAPNECPLRLTILGGGHHRRRSAITVDTDFGGESVASNPEGCLSSPG